MAEFVVEGCFVIKGRGPCITRGSAAGKAARDRGERFSTGQEIRCGDLTATIVGIESFLVPTAPQQGLLLRGVEYDDLAVGQVWVDA